MTAADGPPARETAARDMVGKALALLSRLGEHPEGVTASVLAREVGLPLSTAHRLLGALVRDDYARFEPEGRRYALGLRVFQLAHRVSHARGFAGMARPVMEEVAARTREATLMSVLDGQQQFYVSYVEGPQQVTVIGEPGRHGPLHCTAMGKVLVAFAPRAARERLVESLPLPALGPNTITDRERFREEIATVRAKGYAIADQEHEDGIRAVGVPVLSSRGTATAALSTAAPAYRMSVEALLEFVPVLTQAAKELAVLIPGA